MAIFASISTLNRYLVLTGYSRIKNSEDLTEPIQDKFKYDNNCEY